MNKLARLLLATALLSGAALWGATASAAEIIDDGHRIIDDGRRIIDDGHRIIDDGQQIIDDGHR